MCHGKELMEMSAVVHSHVIFYLGYVLDSGIRLHL